MKAQEGTINHWRKRGKYYGYPKCCIDNFCSQEKRTKEQNRSHDYTGFIPCPEHAKKIFNGEITLQSLITNREHEKPFPES